MGFLGSVGQFGGDLAGLGGQMLGAGKGSNWAAPDAQYGLVQAPVNPNQVNQAYDATQVGLQQQQDFMKALQAQNGIGNQTAAYNAMQGLANGTGPNPAQAALNQATGANVANQAALMASQRGTGANAGLIARQAANQGANIQQQAAGQGATMQAQQALSGIQGMANIAGQQVGQQANATTGYNQAAQSEQQNLLGSIAAANNARAGIAASQNTANTAIQVQNSKAQQGLFGGLLGGAGSILAEGGMVEDAPKIRPNYDSGGLITPNITSPGSPNSPSGPQSNVGKFLYGFSGKNPTSNDIQQNNTVFETDNPMYNGAAKLGQNIAGKIKNAFKSPPPFSPGDAAAMKGIGTTDLSNSNMLSGAGENTATESGLTGEAGAGLDTSGAAAAEGTGELASAGTAAEGVGELAAAGEAAEGASTLGSLAALAAKGGRVQAKVPALVSPGERYLPPKEVEKVAKGKKEPLKAGEKIPGKPKYKGNDYRNDIVPKTLESGGLVIPNKVLQSKDPHAAAAAFVRAVLAKNKHGLK